MRYMSSLCLRIILLAARANVWIETNDAQHTNSTRHLFASGRKPQYFICSNREQFIDNLISAYA